MTAPQPSGAHPVAVIRRTACALLLGGPIALAFFSGGYFDEPRAWAGLGAWLLVVLSALTARRVLPRTATGRVAVASLVLLGGWTLLSITWAPLAGGAYHRGQIVMLYAGGLIAAAALLEGERLVSVAELAVAGGTAIVVGYGISERLLPGLLRFAHSISAEGRLEQPLTYWNTMGEVAALGLVLCLRLGGDARRARTLRLLAVAAAAPLGMGLYISFSRGALFAAGAGLVTLVVTAPWREQLRLGAIGLAAALLGAAAAAPFRAVTSLAGSGAYRERQGALALTLLVAVMALAVAAGWWATRDEVSQPLRLPRAAPRLALLLICLGLAAAILAGAKEHSSRALSTGAQRLGTLQSNRYAYWDIALRAFADEPVWGVGAGGWSVYWLRYRHIDELAQDAHSLPLQTLAELGLVGFALLMAFVGSMAVAAVRAHRAAPSLAAGPIAGIVTYIAHAPLDWDWQMPAVTLFALILAGAVLTLAERSAPRALRRSAAPRAGTPIPPAGIAPG